MGDNKKNLKINRFFKGKFIIIALVIILIVFGATKFFVTGNAIFESGDIQIVKMKVSGSSYVLEPSTVKMGIPVKIVADMSEVTGCSRSVVISAFNVRKSLSSSNNIIEFTPNKAGTFNIACSMNMYQGTFTVLDSNGAKSNYVELPQTGGGTCGSSNGGCGCGG